MQAEGNLVSRWSLGWVLLSTSLNAEVVGHGFSALEPPGPSEEK